MSEPTDLFLCSFLLAFSFRAFSFAFALISFAFVAFVTAFALIAALLSRLLRSLILLIDQSEAAASASVAIVVDSHEGRSATVRVGALAPQAYDLVGLIHLQQSASVKQSEEALRLFTL